MFEQAFKNIDDVLWKEAGCSSELDYTEQSSWMLFLKYLDDLEIEQVAEYESGLYDFLDAGHAELLSEISDKGKLDEEREGRLRDVIAEYTEQFKEKTAAAKS